MSRPGGTRPGSNINTHILNASGRNLESLKILDQVQDEQVEELLLDRNMLSILDQFPSAFSNIKRLNLSQNLIFTLRHRPFHNLQRLQVLILSHNSLRSIEGLDGLQYLQHLDLSHNSISKVIELGHLGNLRSLDLSFNELEQIDDLSANQALEHLNVSSNLISSLNEISDRLPASLQFLDLSNNSVCSIQSLTFLSGMNALQTLICDGNPFIITAARSNYNYRSFVCFVLPSIAMIDDRRPSIMETKEGQQLFSGEGSSDLSMELLSLLDAGHEQLLEKYLRTVCPIELKSLSVFNEIRENLDERSSSQLVLVNEDRDYSESCPPRIWVNETCYDEFMSTIRSINKSLSYASGSVRGANSSKWILRSVAATVIQSHWRRKRIQSAYKDYIRAKSDATVSEKKCNSLAGHNGSLEADLLYALKEIATLKAKLNEYDEEHNAHLLERNQNM